MSVVIVGGHDRMVQQYKQVCKAHRCKAKVFTIYAGYLGNESGSPDASMIFSNSVSHQMVKSAVTEAEKANADVIRCHTSSKRALNDIHEKL